MLPVCFQSFYFTLCSLNWGSQRWVGFPAAASPLILGIPSKAGAQMLLCGSLHKGLPGIQKTPAGNSTVKFRHFVAVQSSWRWGIWMFCIVHCTLINPRGMGGKKDGMTLRKGINTLICRHVHSLGQGETVPSSLVADSKKAAWG